MKIHAFVVVAAAAMLPGCAHRPVNPNAVNIGSGLVVDATGKDRGRVMKDADECQGIAQATAPEETVAAGAIAGAVAGALIGALIWRATGDSGNAGAAYGAGLGALSGTGSGAADAAANYSTVLRNCMLQRGHPVLN